MHPAPPPLPYGVDPGPGAVVYREAADGSVHIEVTPKSPKQVLPVMAWGVACLLAPLAALAWLWARGRVEGWFVLVGVFVSLHLLVAFPLIVYRTGRKRLHIAAGPAGLSISTTEFGDPVQYDWDRATLEDVSVRYNADGENLFAFAVRLRGRLEPVVVQVYRDARATEEIVRRIRRAVGLE